MLVKGHDSGSWRDLLSYYSVWSKALIGTCQVFGGPSGIALTLVEVMDIRKSSHCAEQVKERREKSSEGGEMDTTSRTQRYSVEARNSAKFFSSNIEES